MKSKSRKSDRGQSRSTTARPVLISVPAVATASRQDPSSAKAGVYVGENYSNVAGWVFGWYWKSIIALPLLLSRECTKPHPTVSQRALQEFDER